MTQESREPLEAAKGVEVIYVDEEWHVVPSVTPLEVERFSRDGRSSSNPHLDPFELARIHLSATERHPDQQGAPVPSTLQPAPCFPLLGSEKYDLHDERVVVTNFRLTEPIEGTVETQSDARGMRVVGFSVERRRDLGETRPRVLHVNWRFKNGTYSDAVYIIRHAPDEVEAPGLQRAVESGIAIAAAAGELAERDADHLTALRKDYEELFGGQPKTNFKGFWAS